jgi:osmotically-inducible protein OsmY
MASGEEIVKRVHAALEHDPRVGLHRHPIGMRLGTDGVLTLEGQVANIAAKKLALEHAAAIPGVIGIVDRIRVAPTRPMSDAEIREHVLAAIVEEPGLDSCAIRTLDSGRWRSSRESALSPTCSIDVAVDDGVVTLNGQVPSLSHKRLAGVLAWWVPGSRDVVNGLEVVPDQPDNPGEVTEAVKLALQKDPLVNAELIRVRTRDAAVTLEGLVANASEREMAEMDAWCVFGVDRVVNKLEVRT